MSNNQLPAKVQERINKEADKFSYMGIFNNTPLRNDDKRTGYIAGATAEAERAQILVDDVNRIREIIKGLTAAETHRFPTLQLLDNELAKALQQWKEGRDAPAKEIWVQAQATWNSYPNGTKAKALMGGYWIKTERGWHWPGGGTFPTPGGDATGEICLPDN